MIHAVFKHKLAGGRVPPAAMLCHVGCCRVAMQQRSNVLCQRSADCRVCSGRKRLATPQAALRLGRRDVRAWYCALPTEYRPVVDKRYVGDTLSLSIWRSLRGDNVRSCSAHSLQSSASLSAVSILISCMCSCFQHLMCMHTGEQKHASSMSCDCYNRSSG